MTYTRDSVTARHHGPLTTRLARREKTFPPRDAALHANWPSSSFSRFVIS